MRHIVWTFMLTTFSGGCGDPDPDRAAARSDGCGNLAECSITDSACQNAILKITACVREDEIPPLPAIRVITRDQFRKELIELSDSINEMLDEAAQLEEASFSTALEALHLIAGKGDDTTVAQQTDGVAAFYRLNEKDVSVIADTTMDRFTAMNELAHELTHYLQDRAGQLELVRSTSSTTDEHAARRTLIESEALVTSLRVSAQMMGLPASDVRWSTLRTNLTFRIQDSANASTSPYLVAYSMLPYVLGLDEIEHVWEQDGRAGVDILFNNPPSTQLDWLTDDRGARESAEPLACNAPLPPQGFELVGVDRLGVLGPFALLGTQHSAALGNASTWRQDQLAVYRARSAPDNGEYPVLAVWRMRHMDEHWATSFERSITPLGLALTRNERELSISVSSSAAQAPLSGAALAACPTDQQLTALLPKQSAMPATPRAQRASSRWFGHHVLR